MNHLVDLLIGNIGAVIVIAVSALSLLGKMRINIGNPAGKRPMAPMPSFGGGPVERKRPISPPNPTPEWESQEGMTLEGVVGRIHGSDSVTVKPTAQSDAAGVTDTVLAPSKDDLRRAVLWTEILGPPRAKRPHGR
jgi:hypothetical protein